MQRLLSGREGKGQPRSRYNDGKTLGDFMNGVRGAKAAPEQPGAPINLEDQPLSSLKFFIETYGCQMNVADSEIVESVMRNMGCSASDSVDDADIILANTCAIRENAEV